MLSWLISNDNYADMETSYKDKSLLSGSLSLSMGNAAINPARGGHARENKVVDVRWI